MSAFHSAASFYAQDQSFLSLLLEAGHYLDQCRENAQVSKDDVLDSMEHRLSVLTGKLVASPASAAYCVVPRG